MAAVLNRFKVGCDPELALFDADGKLHHAYLTPPFNLLPADANHPIGQDGGRVLVELRPQPSRSIVALVAALRQGVAWVSYQNDFFGRCMPTAPVAVNRGFHPETGRPMWLGVGGHIHFSRSYKSSIFGLPEKIMALGAMAQTELLYFFPREEVAKRNQSSYGGLTDWRAQPHGFEYRTLPTWMGSPEFAFVMLTAAKILVLSHEKGFTKSLLRLLYEFSAADEDADIAYKLLRRGVHHTTDRLPLAWGVGARLPTKNVTKLAATPAEIEAMRAYLRCGASLLLTPPVLHTSSVANTDLYTQQEGLWYPKIPELRIGIERYMGQEVRIFAPASVLYKIARWILDAGGKLPTIYAYSSSIIQYRNKRIALAWQKYLPACEEKFATPERYERWRALCAE